MTQLLFKLLKALNANQSSGQLALSFVLGLILGLTPLLSPHNLLIVVLIIVLRVNLTALFVSLTFFSGIGYLLEPLFHMAGQAVLQASALQGIFTEWYNQAFWRWLDFNHTVVMGSVVVSLMLAVPMFFVFMTLIQLYRAKFLKWIERFKLVKWLKATSMTGV